MESSPCLTPANSLTSLEQAKICNNILYKIKTSHERKFVLAEADITDEQRNTSYELGMNIFNVNPERVISFGDDTKNCDAHFKSRTKKFTTYEMDMMKSKSDMHVVQILPNEFKEGKSSDEEHMQTSNDVISIIDSDEIMANYRKCKERQKCMLTPRHVFVKQSSTKGLQRSHSNVEGLLYYFMLLFCLCTFFLLIIFL